MEQNNNVIPINQEETQPAAVTLLERKEEPLLLQQVRLKFSIFGSISLIFGGFFAFCFYQAGIGINVMIFTAIMITLLSIIMNKLSLPIKKATKAYYAGAILLGISTALTASDILQVLNLIGILLLLDLSLLHQFHDDSRWDFTKVLAKVFGLVFLSMVTIGMPFVDGIRFIKKNKLFKNEKVMNILIGVVISVPILWIILALLSGADLLFGEIMKGVNQFLFSQDIVAVVFMILFGFIACYCILCGAAANSGREEERTRKKADSSIAITALSLICIVYAFFCGIQLVYLFANEFFVLPAGFTFAEYARRGFFELLTVTIINISLILLCSAFFKESKLLRLVLTFMTACTYIMIISATYRMILYISAYHLTFLRLFVLLALFIDSLVLAGVIVSEYRKKFPLFGYCVAVITVCYLIFSFAKPDYYIASYLIDQKVLLEEEDMIFLTQELSLDATPVVLPLLREDNRWDETNLQPGMSYDDYEYAYYEDVIITKNHMGIRDFNYSNHIAAQSVKEYPRQ